MVRFMDTLLGLFVMNHPCLNSIIYGNMYNYYIIGNVNGLSKIS